MLNVGRNTRLFKFAIGRLAPPSRWVTLPAPGPAGTTGKLSRADLSGRAGRRGEDRGEKRRLTVQQPVHGNGDGRCELSVDFLRFCASASSAAAVLRQPQHAQQQHSRRTNLGTAQHAQQQHSHRFSLPPAGGSRTFGGAMPSAPTEPDDDVDADASFFGRLPRRHPHILDSRHHRRNRPPPADDAAGALPAAVGFGRPSATRSRPQQRPHIRGRRFHTAAQHFAARPSDGDVTFPTAGGRRRPPQHSFRANRLYAGPLAAVAEVVSGVSTDRVAPAGTMIFSDGLRTEKENDTVTRSINGRLPAADAFPITGVSTPPWPRRPVVKC